MAQYVNRRRQMNPNAVDDLVMLDQIKEEKILECLYNRYMQDVIYTSIGPVLIAINPFKMIANLYTDARIREYRGKKAFELPPHVYQLADETYFSMINYRENQCVIITGESGSGKTETSKIIMQYISAVSGRSADVLRVKDRLLSSNPILEGFGNAKTVNNNNSSRFGKYMEILFDFGGDPVGGRVTNYLLEKSRVVGPSQGERNFHVFYQMTTGAGPTERQQFCIESPQYYYYLSASQCYTVPGIDDSADYKEMMEAFRVIGFTEAEKLELHRVVSAILWLGNVAFQEDGKEVSSVADPRVLDVVAGLIQVPTASISNALCNRKIQTGVGNKAEMFTKPNTAAQADFCRDTLAKAMYSRMFDFVVHKINLAIKKDNFQGIHIGVLDIYGFEIFQFNSFEQICINFVNEKLQQIFIELTLQAEQQEYANEGIPWREIPYTNNKPLCDLIEGKPGLLSICDDCCNTGKTDVMYVNDLRQFFGSNQYIHCGSTDFSIRHYAGDVRYDSTNFLSKNKDTLFDDLILVMKSSPCQFIADHGWNQIEISEGQKKRPPTVGFTFKGQVDALMKALKSCVPHYIRCIKPNHEKTPNNLDKEYVMRQVRYLGLVENVRVRRAGYAHRSVFDRFVKRYAMLSKEVWSGRAYGDGKQLCLVICKSLGWTPNKEFAMGQTKIFIQEASTLFYLEELLERRVNDAVVVIQKAYRKYKKRRDYMEMRADCFDLVNGRKERRRGSVAREYKGDYLDFSYNKLVVALMSTSGAREKIIFADRANTPILVGKKNLLEKMFGPKVVEYNEPRFLVLSDKALYSFVYDQEIFPNGQVGPVKIKLYFRVPTLQVSNIICSPFADNFFVLHFADTANVRDVLQSCRRKTEFFGCLSREMKQQGRMLDLRFQPMDIIVVNKEKKRQVEVRWTKDETVDSNTERMVRIKHNVEVKVPSGVSSTSIQAPYRPPKIEASKSPGRPSLRALYDCGGNGVDEISFKAGDIIFIIKDEIDGWYEGELNGQRGFVPATYVERVKLNAGAPAAAKKPFGGAGAGAGAGKSKWQELQTDDGQTYYYNPDTGVSQWDMPAEMKAPPPTTKTPALPAKTGFAAGGGTGFNKFGGGAASSASAAPTSGYVAPSFGGGGVKRNSGSTGKCAFSGCDNPKIGGKSYCALHNNTGGGLSQPAIAVAVPSAAPSYSASSASSSSFSNSSYSSPPSTSSYSPTAAAPAPIAASTAGGGGGGMRPFGSASNKTPSAAVQAFQAQLAARPAGSAVGPAMGLPGMAKPGGGKPAGVAAGSYAGSTAEAPAADSGAVAGGAGVGGAVGGGAAKPASGFGYGMVLPGMGGAGGGAAGPRAGSGIVPKAGPAIPPKKSDWISVKDDASGQFYWYNEKTNVSQWEKPADA